jgi:hypothetical protein
MVLVVNPTEGMELPAKLKTWEFIADPAEAFPS